MNHDVIEVLADLMLLHGTPEIIRSDNGSKFTSHKIRLWLQNAGVLTTLNATVVPNATQEIIIKLGGVVNIPTIEPLSIPKKKFA